MNIITKKTIDENLVKTLCDLCNAVPVIARHVREDNDAHADKRLREDLARLIHSARQAADFAEGELVKITPPENR
jgi:hypothetical protein